MLTNIFAVTAAMAATASAFDCSGHYFSFFNRAGPMSYQRLDPALFPGKESPHLHSFDGGNALSASSTFDSQLDSTCTTARIKPDKSLYWRPTLFWNGNNTGFYPVPEKAAKIYYKSMDGAEWANVTEFPEDFNMIAGDPMKRSDGDNPAGVRWACHQPDGRDDKIFTNDFPTGFQSCDYGFASEATFPSCWNGKKLDPSNPSAHMAYPSNAGVGLENCPTTHRAARFPTIFIEFWYDISSFNGQYSSSSSPWVLSNGDPTGYGMHADFLNGWEKGVLAKATAETGGCDCGCGCGNDEMKQCFGADNINDDSDSGFEQCSAGTGDAITKLDKLPGCNPIQSGPARATAASGAGCDATQIASPGASATSAAVSKASSAVSAVVSDVASDMSSAYSEAFSTTVPAGASVTASVKASSSRTRRVSSSSSVAISISLANKGYAGADSAYPTPAAGESEYDEEPTENDASSSPAPRASGTPAAAESNTPYYPYPSGNSTVAPTASGHYSSSHVRASSKPHGHNHSKFHKTTAAPAGNTAHPSAPSKNSDNDDNAEKADCKGPVTITYTPTVTVTAAANKTASAGTSYTTVTKVSTVTVQTTVKATASGY